MEVIELIFHTLAGSMFHLALQSTFIFLLE